MLKVEKYIEKLLLSHDCVIIPGLGGFVAQYEPSYRVDEDGSFYPPYRTIGFNAQLKMNDGLLAQIYMQTYDTNFPEATRMVQQESDKIKQVLHADGFYQFENIGRLELKSDNNLLFIPESESGIVAPELYGLDMFMMAPYVKKAEQKAKADKAAGPLKKPNPSSPTNTPDSERRNSHYIIRLNRRWTNYAAVALIAFLTYFTMAIPAGDHQPDSAQTMASSTNSVLYGFPVQKLMETEHRSTDAVLPSERIATPKAATITNQTVRTNSTTLQAERQKTSTATSVKQEKVANNKPTVEYNSSQESYYTIVLASSIKEDNARTFIRQLKANGYKEVSIYKKKSMRRVVYSKYPTQEAAQKALRHLRDDEIFEQAWVLKII